MTPERQPVANAVDLDAVAEQLESVLPSAVARNLPVADLSTYRLGGPVAVVVRLGRERDLEPVAAVVAQHRPPVLVIGRGSNLLVADSGFAGLGVLLDGEFEALALPLGDERAPGSADVVRAGGALALPVVARGARRPPDGRAWSSSSGSPDRSAVRSG